MDIWKILGIEPTKDENELKAAYRNKLVGVNPEDDAKGFMELRKAYEEALKEARSNNNIFDKQTEAFSGNILDFSYKNENNDALSDEAGTDILNNLIVEIYRDFAKRKDEKCWTELLNRDEFISLETSENALNTLLNYLMDHFLLPQNIWKLIVDTFYIRDRRNELCEKYPRDFIDFIIDNSENISAVNYDLFDNDADSEEIDDFIKKYLTLNTKIRKGDLEDAKEDLNELKEGGIYHPYIELAAIKIKLYKLNADADMEEIKALYYEIKELSEECPNDFNIIVQCGDIAIMLKEFEAAGEFYDKADRLEAGSYVMKVKYADLDYFKGDYEKSRDVYMELLRKHNFDNAIRAGMLRANLALIEKYSKELKEFPSDNDKKIELAWSFYQSYRFAEAVEVLSDFEPSLEKVFEYYNVKGRSYLCLMEYGNALTCFYRWKEAIESLEDDGSEEVEKKKKRLPYVNFLIADCYIKTNQYDKAEEFLNAALATEHDEIMLSYEAMCELMYETGRYEECIESCEELLSYSEDNYIAYDYMSKAFFRLNYYKESINACENAIRIYPYAADPYTQEIDIFLNINQIETAKKIIEKYKLFNIPSDQIRLKEAEVLIREEKYEKAYNILKDLFEVNLGESDLSNLYGVYNGLALCCEKTNKRDMAVICLKKLIEYNPEHMSASGRLGIIYRKQGLFKEALKCLNKQIKINPNPAFCCERAYVLRRLERYTAAIEDYEYALTMDEENAAIYSDMAYLYEYTRMYKRALEAFDMAVKYEEDANKRSKLLLNKARVLQRLNNFNDSKAVYEQYIDEFGIIGNFAYDLIYDYSILLQRMNDIDNAVKLIKDNVGNIDDSERKQILLRQLCKIYGEEGYINLAHETYEMIMSQYPKDHKACKIMGDILKEHKLYDDATEYYLKAISLDFETRENYYSDLVENEYCKGFFSRFDKKEIINEGIQKTLKMEKPDNIITDRIKIAKVFRVTKNYAQALRNLEAAKRNYLCFGCFYSECHELYYEMGLLFEAMKKNDKALECYNKALLIKGHCALYEGKIKGIKKK